MSQGPSRNLTQRKGIAAILAMLFLVLIATLAVGFAAATTMNAQIAKNERAMNQARAAADGGMQFVRYQLGQMSLAPTVQTSGLMDAVAQALGQQLNGTPNMNGHTVQNTGGIIYLPSASAWMTVDPGPGTRFRAQITQFGQFLVVTTTGSGQATASAKAIQIQYQKAPKAGAILNYGVASKGTISTGGSTLIQGQTDPTKGSVFSADMISSTPVSIGG